MSSPGKKIWTGSKFPGYH